MSQTVPPDDGPDAGAAGAHEPGSRSKYWVEPPPPLPPREIKSFEPGAKIVPPHSVEEAGQGIPYLPPPPVVRARPSTFGAVHLGVLLACGAAMIGGSFGPWVNFSVTRLSVNTTGMQIGLGHVSFIAGIVLVAAVVSLIALTGSGAGGLISQLIPASAGAALGTAVYFLWGISGLHVLSHLRWGVYLVVFGSFVALLYSGVVNRS
jgi:hypothetical protein